MKYLIPILLAVVVLSSGCDCDGYSCNSDGCYADDNAQYLTLEDCLSVCDELNPKPGSCGAPVLHEGYAYSTVQIGDQCWFSENCRYLPAVSPLSEVSDYDPYYYVYDYQGSDVTAAQATDNYATYGVLYNWPAVMTEGICPSGWHIPSDEEFTQLSDYLGGSSVGGQMKEAGNDHWNFPNIGATNYSGFTGLPGGYRYSGGFGYNGSLAFLWTSSVSAADAAWRGKLQNDNDGFASGQSSKNLGFSARCLQD